MGRSSSQDWAEEGHQALMDDSRSSSSLKSDGPAHHNVAALHIMDGETHFPTAMSYVSDAQRSDVGTVCSGSVMDDNEVESVLSQEDSHNHLTQSHNYHQSPSIGDRTIPVGGTMRRVDSSGRVVEFSSAQPPLPQLQNEIPSRKVAPTVPAIPNVAPPPAIPNTTTLQVSLHNMGPPLNRTWLLQKGIEGTSSRPSSVRSFGSHTGSDGAANAHSDDCGGSLDVEAHSVHSQEDIVIVMHPAAGEGVVPEPPTRMNKEPSSRPSSVKSFGSLPGSDTAAQVDTDDCGGSLDVETHSVETRSVHSQEEAPPTETTTTETTAIPNETEESKLNLSLVQCASDTNGRRSPGGTIYKGRGTRRYKGRYMHLPLKRFHQNGVDLQSVHEDADRVFDNRRMEIGEHTDRFSHGQHASRRSRSRSRSPDRAARHGDGIVARAHNGFHEEHWQDHDSKFPPRNRIRSRSRSRSRSQSPSLDKSLATLRRENRIRNDDHYRQRPHHDNNFPPRNGASRRSRSRSPKSTSDRKPPAYREDGFSRARNGYETWQGQSNDPRRNDKQRRSRGPDGTASRGRNGFYNEHRYDEGKGKVARHNGRRRSRSPSSDGDRKLPGDDPATNDISTRDGRANTHRNT
jgi:hypothetical protein